MPETAESSARPPHTNYRQLLAFFLPLAATPFLIASTHTLANAVMARLPAPVLSLAVFSVVQAATNTLKAPGLLSKEITVSLVDNRQSLAQITRFVTAMALFFTGLLVGIAYTPLGAWFFTTVMGLTDPDSIAFAYSAMRIACFLPLVEVFRNFFQGLSIGVRHTSLITFGTVVRVIVMTLIALWAIRTQSYSGIIVGAFMWLTGIGLEGILLALLFRRRYRSPNKAVQLLKRTSDRPLSLLQIFAFFLPLAAMMFMNTSLQPIVQGLIARSPISPTESLAAYGVAWGLFFILAGPLNMLHQCSLIFIGRGRSSDWSIVRSFVIWVGATVSLLIAATALTPFGLWLMTTVIGVDPEIASLSRWVLLSFSFYPILRAWQEMYWGLMMAGRRTTMISVGKGINLAAALVSLLLLTTIPSLTAILPAAVAAGLAFTAGQGAESIFLWRYNYHHPMLRPNTSLD